MNREIPDHNNWVQTRSGFAFDLRDPQPDMVRIDDIAWALAGINRFAAQSEYYSVAQHSVHVSRIVPPEHAFVGLMHDAAEAYVGDVSQPLKRMLGHAFTEVEDRVWRAICARFNMNPVLPEVVKKADYLACMTERRDLFASHLPWPGEIEPLKEEIVPSDDPCRSRLDFLSQFTQLGGRER